MENIVAYLIKGLYIKHTPLFFPLSVAEIYLEEDRERSHLAFKGLEEPLKQKVDGLEGLWPLDSLSHGLIFPMT